MIDPPPTVHKVAALIPISAELWLEIDMMRRPWAYPDRRVMPMFELFPRLSRWQARWQCVKRHIGQYLTGGDECALMEL